MVEQRVIEDNTPVFAAELRAVFEIIHAVTGLHDPQSCCDSTVGRREGPRSKDFLNRSGAVAEGDRAAPKRIETETLLRGSSLGDNEINRNYPAAIGVALVTGVQKFDLDRVVQERSKVGDIDVPGE